MSVYTKAIQIKIEVSWIDIKASTTDYNNKVRYDMAYWTQFYIWTQTLEQLINMLTALQMKLGESFKFTYFFSFYVS